jgi:GNAT superfamily N-acetyltransferase
MSRSLVSLRSALPSDATVLSELWSEVVRRAEPEDQLADLVAIIETAAASEHERLVVAEYDGEVAGAVHLRVTTMTPINLEPVVQAVSPHVLPRYRRRGVGRALMDAAVSYAEEVGVGHVVTAASSGSRDANRFMARLALGPWATLRVASTPMLRSKVTAQHPTLHRSRGRRLPQVVAVRRSMRRSDASAPATNEG